MPTKNAAAPGGVANYYNVEVPWQVVAGGATSTLYLDPPVSLGEMATLAALVEVKKVGSPGVGGTITLKASVENVAGVLTNVATGSTSVLYADVSTPAGANLNAALAGCFGAVVASAVGLAVQVTAPGGVAIYARANIDISRGQKPPAVAVSISPSAGAPAGGTTVTITGEGFSGGAISYVTLTSGTNGPSPVKPTIVSDTSLTFVTPAWTGALSAFDVGLVRADGTYALAGAFTYTAAAPPTVSAVTPDAGVAGSTTTFTITGTNLTAGTVTIGGAAGTVTGNTGTVMTVTGPSSLTASATPVDVVVTAPGGTATKAASVTVLPSGLISNYDASIGITLNVSAVSALADAQGGFNATQATGANQPTGTVSNYNASGLTAITYTGGTQLLVAGAFPATAAPIEAIFVGDAAATTGPFGMIAGQAGANFRTQIQNPGGGPQVTMNDGTGSAISSAVNSITPTTPFMVNLCDNGASSAILLNNTSIATGTLSTGIVGITANSLGLGATFGGGSSLSGHLAQVLLWGKALSTPERAIVHTYVAAKWKTP